MESYKNCKKSAVITASYHSVVVVTHDSPCSSSFGNKCVVLGRREGAQEYTNLVKQAYGRLSPLAVFYYATLYSLVVFSLLLARPRFFIFSQILY